MTAYISTPRGLATIVGATILAASVNANVMQTGGYFSSHALLVIALSLGVFAGARVVGAGVSGKIATVIIVALFCGEGYNLAATAERIVVERENGAAPLKDAKAKHDAAVDKLSTTERAAVGSARLSLALEAQTKAQAAYQLELRTGGRCRSICNGLKADADKADKEVSAAADEAQKLHIAAVEAAKKDVEANPLPASATPFADRLHVPAWLLDLVIAGLLSFGSNVLAGVLIAFGARNGTDIDVGTIVTVADNSQTDFDPAYADNTVRFFRPDNGGTGGSGKRGPDRPKKPGPSSGLSKSEALDDLMQRLSDGRTIGSQDELAADWNRPKQTVSDWLREWRRIGVVPAPVKTGRCKSFVAG